MAGKNRGQRPGTTALAVPAGLMERAMDYAGQAAAPNTIRAYRSDWRAFEEWTLANGLAALPVEPSTLALYATTLAEAGKRCSTISRALAAVNHAQKTAGHKGVSLRDEPLHSVWRGIRRTKGTAPGQKAPFLVADLRAAAEAMPPTVRGQRDRALLLLGFAGAFRRSELVALDVADLEFSIEGATALLRRSKTDQEGQGAKVGIPYGRNPATCPVRNLLAWLESAGILEGAVFRPVNKGGRVLPGRLTDRTVALVVKEAALAAGLDPTQYSGHSLRAGLATAAASEGVHERVIMAQTRHKGTAMVRRYIRAGSLFKQNAAAQVGL